MKVINIHSDGGVLPVGRGDWSAGAAIVIPGGRERRFKIATLLPSGSSAQAELAAALLGFAVLHAQYPVDGQIAEPLSEIRYRWSFDFASLQVHATRREDRFCSGSLTEAYSFILRELAVPVPLEFLHVQSHSGVRLNEACDRACRWVLHDGEKLLRRYGAGMVGRNAVLAPEDAWLLCDLRPIFQQVSTLDTEQALRSWWVDFVAFLREFTSACC
ncbi:MAG: hypothetical protein PHC51_13430 [bacterium]|nr:hypothetical protein [bacterium]